MTIKYGLHKCLQLGVTGLLGCLSVSLLTSKTQAQQSNIVPDNTLGAESSQIIGNFQGQPIEVITGGAIRQINLFHSFGEFNVSADRGAYFFIPNADIQNVLARVTGGNRSEILGKLGTFQIINGSIAGSNANLFLINPNGIIFGQNASLDVQGSFMGTTANGVQFANQGVFSATNPQTVPLLTINPSALLFNQINQNGIINRSRQIATPGSLYLIGGDITFDGGVAASLGNRLELGAVARIGNVELIGSGNQTQLAFPEGLSKADIALQNNAFVLTGGNTITVNARDISLSGNSFIRSVLQTGEGQPGVAAGDIVVNASGNVTLDNSDISNQGLQNSLGDTGNVAINAQSISLTNQSQITTTGTRSRGNIILNAKDNLSLNNNSLISTFGIFNPIGKSGDITIATRNINLSNESTISSANTGQGQGGKITLKAQEAISLMSGSNILSASVASGFGQVNNQPSGDIEIKTRTLTLDGDNTSINSSNSDEGRGGNIRIIADDSILLNGFAPISSSSIGQGNSGNIELQTRSLTLTNGGNIITSTSGGGNGGDLLVNASDSVTLSGISTLINPQTGENIGGSSLSTSAFGAGNSGQLTIDTQRLSINDGGNITTSATGQTSKGGNLTINAKDSVELGSLLSGQNSTISTGTSQSGDAGNLNINTGRLSIRDGSLIATATLGTGKGGNLTVDAKNSVEVVGGSPNSRSTISTSGLGSGDAGNLNINTGRLSIRDGAFVSTNISSQGKGGNLAVNADHSVELIGSSTDGRFPSSLLSSTNPGSTGDAGDLTVTTKDLLLQGGVVNAGTFGAGKGGNLIVNTQNALVQDGAIIFAGTSGAGNGGNLTINADHNVQIIGSSPVDGRLTALRTSTSLNSTGNAGNLTIKAQNLLVRDGAQVFTSTFGAGKAGNLTVNASRRVELIGRSADSRFPSGLLASAEPNSTGDAGDLKLDTPQLLVRNGAEVLVNARGKGNAGIMTINSDTINLDNQASLNANTRSPNKDPNREQATINLNTQNLTLRDGSSITTNATGENVFGGNINIYTTKFFIALENSRISANSDNSRGGRVVVNSQGVFVGTQPSDVSKFITATSGVGLSGTVEVNSPDNSSIQNTFTELSPVIDANALIANSCISRGTKRQENSFTITGSGALTPNRPGVLVSNYTTGEVRGVETISHSWKKGDPIIEPTGVYRLNNGQLLLSRECS
ncbi:filamentous hemagglutinin N-terminal domain-containing protein [Nostoc sp. DedQUE02]|uniref:two-partner secretion domain-containing protein n=1 Tax=Nostoc sp. DedQUE02 TaxID=3075388 RepID=UPI00391DF574